MKKYVSEETRNIMEKQFAECKDLMEVSELYADFLYVSKELYVDAFDNVLDN